MRSKITFTRSIPQREDIRSPVANNTQIIGFYSGTLPDHRGCCLHEIQKWADGQLETAHDYIQWLFPLPERSGFNVGFQAMATRPLETRLRIDEFLPTYDFSAVYEIRIDAPTSVVYQRLLRTLQRIVFLR